MEIDFQLIDCIGVVIYVDSIICIVYNYLLIICIYYLIVIDQRKENRKMIKQKISLKVSMYFESKIGN